MDKQNPTHVETFMPEKEQIMKATHEDLTGDVGLQMFNNINAVAEDIDPHAEKRLVRKIDWYIIPIICVTYLITYIDKATLGYGALFGMSKDVGLVGTQYSWLG